MKKVIFVIALLILPLIFYKCVQDDVALIPKAQSFKNIHQLKSDIRFVNLIDENISLIANIRDINRVKTLTSKENLTPHELDELAQALGFNSSSDYTDFFLSENMVLQELQMEYNLSYYDNSLIKEAAIESIRKKAIASKEAPNNCERIRVNCLASAAAGAVLGHLACASVDWTGIGVPLCHGAVIVLQIAASDTCNAEAENCGAAVPAS